MIRARCWSPLELESVEHEDGTVETEVKVLEIGRKVQRGGAGEFEVTPQHLEEMVRNHEADMARGYEPPAVVGHPRERDQAPAVGWIKGLRAAADGLFARVRFLGDFARRVRAGEYRYNSPTFAFNWHDESGEARGAKLLDLGILNNPFQKSLGAFALSEIDASEPGTAGEQLTIPEVGDDPTETQDMADEKNATVELAAQVADLQTKNTTLDEQIKTMSEERDTLAASLSEREAEIVKLTEQIESAQRKADGMEIDSVVRVALNDGKLAPAQVPGFGTDSFDGVTWLSDSPFAGLDGLRKHLKTAPRVVDLGERSSAPSSDDASDAGRRDRIESFAVAALAANPRLTREQAIELATANA